MKINPILYLAIGAIFGVAIYVGIQASHAPVDKSISTSADLVKRAETAIVEQKKRATQLDQREEAIKQQEEKLTAAMSQSLGAGSTSVSTAPGSTSSSQPGLPGVGLPGASGQPNKTSSAVAAQLAAIYQQQNDLKMTALKSRLQLSDEQAKAIQDLLDHQNQLRQDLTAKMLSGGMSKDELQKASGAVALAGGVAQIRSILTPDQNTEYLAYLNDERRSTAEGVANSEVMQIQNALQLSNDQKDKVFTAVYQVYAQQLGVDGVRPTVVVDLAEAKKTALQSVLTPDQFDAYSKFADAKKQMAKQALDVITNGSAAPAGSAAVPSP